MQGMRQWRRGPKQARRKGPQRLCQLASDALLAAVLFLPLAPFLLFYRLDRYANVCCHLIASMSCRANLVTLDLQQFTEQC